MKQPLVQEAMALYPLYKRGITPNGRGTRHETAIYIKCMLLLEQHEAGAANWYQKELQRKRK